MNKAISMIVAALALAACGQSARLGSLGRNDTVVTNLAPATNYTDEALGQFAATGTITRALSYGTPNRWVDTTGCVWEVTADKAPWTGGPRSPLLWSDEHGGWISNPSTDLLEWSSGTWMLGSGSLTTTFTCSGEWGAMRLVLHSEGPEPDVILERGLLTNLVGRVALTDDIPDVSGFATAEYADSAASAAVEPVSNLVETVRAESALVYRLYQGSNVVAEVTNYNSQVHAPELRIMQLNESNEYVVVWAETNGLSRTLASARQYADAATGAVVQAVAPRAWSKVTAGLGFDAPSNTTWLSTGRTVIAGGLEYEKHMTSGGAIWLLESNGMTADFHAQTNNTAFIDLSNADGTPIFRVEKTDSFLVGVHVDSVTVDGDALVCGVGVVAADHPLVRVKAQLGSGEWAKEEDGIPASLATVTWSGTTGNWTCRIQNNTGGTIFAQMEYFQEGGTKIVNSAALDVSEGILCTDGIHKGRPVYSNGSITWEVVP